MVMDGRKHLGELLVDEGLLTDKQLEMALEYQQKTGGKLGMMITKLGFISEEKLTGFIAEHQGLPVVNLSELILPEALIRRLPADLMRKHHVVPIRYHEGVLTVAMADSTDFEAIDEIQLAVDHRVEVNLAPRRDIDKAIAEIFDRETGLFRKEDLLKELDSVGGGDGDLAFLETASSAHVTTALISLLVEKGVFTAAELKDRIEASGA